MIGEAKIIRGDALSLPIADNSVDLIVTSPPYFGLRSYTDGGKHYAGQIGDEATPTAFVDHLVAATSQMIRVLKPTGSIWVNLGDKYATRSAGLARSDGQIDSRASAREANPRRPPAYRVVRGTGTAAGGVREKSLLGLPWRYAIRCIDELGLILRAEVIWSKPNGLPESVTDRVRRSHEQWFHFTAQPRYFSAVDEIREPTKPGQSPAALSFDRPGRGTAPGQSCTPHRLERKAQGLHPLGKLPGSVWEVATQPLNLPDHLGVDHFAAFPMEWPRRIIRSWSPADGTVLDPFGGTGTTALLAKMLGRTGISVDMSADYCRAARWRTSDPGQMALAAGIAKVDAIAPEQTDLLNLLEEVS